MNETPHTQANTPAATPEASINPFDMDFTLSAAEIDELMQEPESNDAPLGHALPPPDFTGAEIANMSDEELAQVPVVAAGAYGAPAEFALAFLEAVRDEYAAHGIAARTYVFQFPRKVSRAAIASFKRNLTVRISNIRKAATAQGVKLEPFWVTFTSEEPLSPDAEGKTAVWVCTVARMNELQYKGYARERAKKNASSGDAAALVQATIGALL